MTLPDLPDKFLLLHNPRCSKSRAVLALLEQAGVTFDERRYLEDPLSRPELEDLARRLGRPIREWTRMGEATFGDAGLTRESDADALLNAMAEHPILMERPILVHGDDARVGRPPEAIRELLPNHPG